MSEESQEITSIKNKQTNKQPPTTHQPKIPEQPTFYSLFRSARRLFQKAKQLITYKIPFNLYHWLSSIVEIILLTLAPLYHFASLPFFFLILFICIRVEETAEAKVYAWFSLKGRNILCARNFLLLKWCAILHFLLFSLFFCPAVL